jgi:hypothetical protein
MKWIGAIFFLPILALASPDGPGRPNAKVSQYLLAYSSAAGNYSASSDKVFSFLDKMASKRKSFKSEQAFLSYVFSKTHQRFLKTYQDPSSFDELLKNGTYNCLTGTALYALILEQLNISHQVVETNHHIFLIANTNEGPVLLETTDAIAGFESNPTEIEKKINAYKTIRAAEFSGSKKSYQFTVSLYNTVNLDGLLGLLHYNLAVTAYNSHKLADAIDHLEKAYQYYDSPRMEEFKQIVSLTIREQPMEKQLRDRLLKKMLSLNNSRQHIVASSR